MISKRTRPGNTGSQIACAEMTFPEAGCTLALVNPLNRTELVALRVLAEETDLLMVVCVTKPGDGWHAVGTRELVWFLDGPVNDLPAFAAELAGTAPVIWRWRRAFGLDCLSVPDGILVSRSLGGSFPLAPFVGEPEVPALKSSEITGSPRWLIGMALAATRRSAALEQRLERL